MHTEGKGEDADLKLDWGVLQDGVPLSADNLETERACFKSFQAAVND